MYTSSRSLATSDGFHRGGRLAVDIRSISAPKSSQPHRSQQPDLLLQSAIARPSPPSSLPNYHALCFCFASILVDTTPPQGIRTRLILIFFKKNPFELREMACVAALAGSSLAAAAASSAAAPVQRSIVSASTSAPLALRRSFYGNAVRLSASRAGHLSMGSLTCHSVRSGRSRPLRFSVAAVCCYPAERKQIVVTSFELVFLVVEWNPNCYGLRLHSLSTSYCSRFTSS